MTTPAAPAETTPSMWRQPRAVWAVAFACVIAFMGIGLVDPILKPIADELGASPSETSLLFTSYMAIMGVAMLVAGFISSRIGAKRTLITGLALIIVFSALAGMSDSIGAIVGFRAGWGLGNALFVATALSTIVVASAGSVGQAVIFFEAALGLGIAVGPIVGGQLGSISWRAPFFGVAVLMVVAVVVTSVLLPATPPSGAKTSLAAPLKALRHPGLLTVALTALFYNMGFFTLLAFTPFPLDMSASQVGWVFFGWGLLLAITSVKTAPWLQRRFGTIPSITGALTLFALDLAMMALLNDSRAALVVGVVLAGAFLGVNNTLITEAVMGSAPVERPVASSAYSFVRFSGGAVAPWAAGRLGEEVSLSAPFWMGTVAVLVGVAIFTYGSRFLRGEEAPATHSDAEGEAVLVGGAD
ncbi:Predicted arabinose efflux permease, MFS family [Janibacter indicus]|uniref:Predicted arabinose efflux permease, MFS family n=2 Tax=Intrasporangiaceae TaxID=85021 RepID=A0A1W2C627_9MICO|nr:MFS transporter [Janibacter indicus]SMC80566.1 Predicted arabinose efflux permease, MFS family [Janibacter indicus]